MLPAPGLPSTVAKSHRDSRRAGKKIAIVFDNETFDQIAGIAARRNISFARITRELVKFGLLDVEEARRG